MCSVGRLEPSPPALHAQALEPRNQEATRSVVCQTQDRSDVCMLTFVMVTGLIAEVLCPFTCVRKAPDKGYMLEPVDG